MVTDRDRRPLVCARCQRSAVDGWKFTGWLICDRVSCVRSATWGLVRGILPDDVDALTDAARAAIDKFDARQRRNRPGPPPWARSTTAASR